MCNLAIHKEKPKDAADLVEWAFSFLSEFQGTQKAMSTGPVLPNVPPNPPGELKLHSDAAIREGQASGTGLFNLQADTVNSSKPISTWAQFRLG
ncbi:hypothetical protein QYF36_022642 [Acer negundo]|nr:hypothetical protein QYF36_022642 [Acer negundo]